jgi:hypothetical protein
VHVNDSHVVTVEHVEEVASRQASLSG